MHSQALRPLDNLEVVFQCKLDDAVAKLQGRHAEVRIAVRRAPIVIEIETVRPIAASAETPNWMVHEVVRREAELELLALLDLEILEKGQVAGPEPRSEEFRQNGRTVRPWCRRKLETVSV